MAEAYVCENCGRLYAKDHYDLLKFRVKKLGLTILRIYFAYNSDIYSSPQDVCDKCMKKYLQQVIDKL